jgi:hypothetical protein
MRNPSSRMPIDQFDLPPFPPEKVAEAKANFDRLSDLYAEARASARELQTGKLAALKEANHVAAQHRLDGTSMPRGAAPDKVEEQYDKKLAAVQADAEVTRLALDEAGDQLAAEISVHRESWSADLQAEADAALDAFNVAVAEARDALLTLGFARGGPAWLANFNIVDARHGLAGQFSGGTVAVGEANVGVSLDTFTPAITLLDVARIAAQPVVPRTPRTLKTTKESSPSLRIDPEPRPGARARLAGE